MTENVTTSMLIIPEPTVFATAVPKVNAATKLKNAAQMTAWPGESTRVETTVAIELAASWKPLRKSNINAVRISPTTIMNVGDVKSMLESSRYGAKFNC